MMPNTRTVALREFVDMAVTRIEAAGERGDLEEAARLLFVLRDAVDDAARVITRQAEAAAAASQKIRTDDYDVAKGD